jgi:hypothetical protein
MNSNETHINLGIMLELLRTSFNYQEDYIKTFPENEEHALSYSVDPECSCKQKLIDHYKVNFVAVEKLNETFAEKHPNEINLKELISRLEIKNVAGQYFKIQKTPDAYQAFVTNMKEERWAFRHMSVTTEENEFIIFFA